MLKVVAESFFAIDERAMLHASDDSVIYATYIFTRVMISKMVDANNEMHMPIEMQKREAELAGERIAKMVEYFTTIDHNKIKDKYAH